MPVGPPPPAYDVQYDIPVHIPDTKCLSALITASSGFSAIYEKYKAAMPGILNEALFEDASKYKEESYFIAYFADSFRTKRRDLSDLDTVLLGYPSAKFGNPRRQHPSTSSSPSSYPKPWYHARITKGQNEFRDRVIANHKVILELCEQFVNKMKYPKLLVDIWQGEIKEEVKQKYLQEGAPATIAEKERITRGLYRLWVLSMVYCAELVPEPEDDIVDTEFSRFLTCYRCLGGLDYWDVKVVQILMSYFSKELKPVFQTFQAEETVVKQNFLNGDYSAALTEEIYTGHYFNAFMWNEFPHNASDWIKNSSDPKLLSERFSFLSSTIASKLSRGLSAQEQLSAHVSMVKDVRGWHARDRQYPGALIAGSEVDEDVPLKRLLHKTEVGDGVGHKPPHVSPAVRKAAWLAIELTREDSTDSDYWGAIWDDKRLAEWGYQFPVFEERKAALRNHLRRISSILRITHGHRQSP
ncbi:hypothetical protein ABW20_dc0108347 [Dactylellina cionopaga]|nr:hypothetical protein ABW20_dc0108347 [Dactylellina cionopaga]